MAVCKHWRTYERVQKPSADARSHIPDGQLEVAGRSFQSRVCAEAASRRHTHHQRIEPSCAQLNRHAHSCTYTYDSLGSVMLTCTGFWPCKWAVCRSRIACRALSSSLPRPRRSRILLHSSLLWPAPEHTRRNDTRYSRTKRQPPGLAAQAHAQAESVDVRVQGLQRTSIFALIGWSRGYKKLKSVGFWQAALTAFASSTAPFPPYAWCSDTTASSAPAMQHQRHAMLTPILHISRGRHPSDQTVHERQQWQITEATTLHTCCDRCLPHSLQLGVRVRREPALTCNHSQWQAQGVALIGSTHLWPACAS